MGLKDNMARVPKSMLITVMQSIGLLCSVPGRLLERGHTA